MGYVDLITAAQDTLQGVDFRNLRKLYAGSPIYAPYNFKETEYLDQARELMGKNEFDKALFWVQKVLNSNFLNLHAHLAAKQIHEKTGEHGGVGYHGSFIQGLINALMTSGDGLSYESAFVVLTIAEEYIVLDVLRLERTSQKTEVKDGNHFDVLITKDRNGNAGEVYFNINAMKGLLQEPDRELTPTTVIGKQEWTTSNLDVDQFRNGDAIPEAKTKDEWRNAGRDGKPVWCYPDNDEVNGKDFGRLYNWYAVNDPRGLAPAGWRIPNDDDWGTLIKSLGGRGIAGVKMKSVSDWGNNGQGTNESGFNGLAGGGRIYETYDGIFTGTFSEPGVMGGWWSSSETRPTHARIFSVVEMSWGLASLESAKPAGASVRCLKI